MSENFTTVNAVQDHYGNTLQATTDLQTSACSSQPLMENLPPFIQDIFSLVHEEIKSKYYGCGPIYPTAVKGMNILDVGSGCGQDSFVLSKLVGPNGSVTGLDMTEKLLELSSKYIDYHTKVFNLPTPNTSFVKGFMEKMEESGLKPGQFDLLVSNGVINLSKDKKIVLNECFKMLKDGGELYFTDVYADRELPQCVRNDKELWCECVAGVLHWRELYKLAAEVGFAPPRLVSAGIYDIGNLYKKSLGDTRFVSLTYRLFKVPPKSPEQATVVYNGGIEGFEDKFDFDHGVFFEKGEECTVDSGLISILTNSRYQNFFTITPGIEKGPTKTSKVEKDPFELIAEKEG